MHVHACIHASVHACIHASVHVYTCAYAYAYAYTCICIGICMHTYACAPYGPSAGALDAEIPKSTKKTENPFGHK